MQEQSFHGSFIVDRWKQKVRKCVSAHNFGHREQFLLEGGKGGIVIPFHAQILTKFTRHVLNQSLSEKPQGNEIFTTKHK